MNPTGWTDVLEWSAALTVGLCGFAVVGVLLSLIFNGRR